MNTTLFLGAHKIKNPEVILRCESLQGPRTGDDYKHEVRNGTFYKILHLTGREHAALNLLQYGEERFAPYRGDGVLITDAAFRKFQSND